MGRGEKLFKAKGRTDLWEKSPCAPDDQGNSCLIQPGTFSHNNTAVITQLIAKIWLIRNVAKQRSEWEQEQPDEADRL